MDINQLSQKYGGSGGGKGGTGGGMSLDSFMAKHASKEYVSTYQEQKKKKQLLDEQLQSSKMAADEAAMKASDIQEMTPIQPKPVDQIERENKWAGVGKKFGEFANKVEQSPIAHPIGAIAKKIAPKISEQYHAGRIESESVAGSAIEWMGGETGSEAVRGFGKGYVQAQKKALEDQGLMPKGTESLLDKAIRSAPVTLGGVAVGVGATLATKNPKAGYAAGMAYTGIMEGGAAYQEAVDRGATEEEAQVAARITGGVNAVIEMLPMSRWINKTPGFRKVVGGAVKKGVFQKIASVGIERLLDAGAESVTEIAQSIVNNLAAKFAYDPEQDWSEGALESGIIGAIMGGGIGTALDVGNRMAGGGQPNGDVAPPTLPPVQTQVQEEKPENEAPKYNPQTRVKDFVSALENNDTKYTEENVHKLSKDDLDKVYQVLDQASQMGASADVESDKQYIKDLLDERASNLKETAGEIVSKGTTDNLENPVIHPEDVKHVNTTLDQVGQATGQEVAKVDNSATLPAYSEYKGYHTPESPFVAATTPDEVNATWDEANTKLDAKLNEIKKQKNDLLASKKATTNPADKKAIQTQIDEIDKTGHEVADQQAQLENQAIGASANISQKSIDEIKKLDPSFDLQQTIEDNWDHNDYVQHLSDLKLEKGITEEKKSAVVEGGKEIKTALDAAKELIRNEVLRGDTINQIQSGYQGHYNDSYGAKVASKGKIEVERVGGNDVNEVFSLKKIYDEIATEKEGNKKPEKVAIEKPKATKPEKKKYYINEAQEFKEVKAKPVVIPGHEKLDLFIHKSPQGWVISEGKSGMRVVSGRSTTQQDALDEAKTNLDKHKDKLDELMKEAQERGGTSPRHLTTTEKSAKVVSNKYERSTDHNLGGENRSGANAGTSQVGKNQSTGTGKYVAKNEQQKPSVSGVGNGELGKRYADGQRLTKLQIEELVQSKSKFSDEEKAILRSYEGSGGTAEGEGRGVLDEFYTPKPIVDKMWGLVKQNLPLELEGNLKVLEPSAGTGRFIESAPTGTDITAYETNPISAKITKVLNPETKIVNKPFEDMFMDEKGGKKVAMPIYDVVIGNPPYGIHRGKYKGLGEEKKLGRYEEYFIKRALDVTKEGGIVAIIVPSGFLRGKFDYAKGQIAMRGDLVDAYRLPNKSFKSTAIGTDILIIKKHYYPATGEQIIGDMWANDTYFKSNPDKVLGTETEKSGKFGMVKYTEGKLDEAMDRIEAVDVGETRRDAIEQVDDNIEQIEQEQPVTAAVRKEAVRKALKVAKTKTKAQKKGDNNKLYLRDEQSPYILDSIKKDGTKIFLQGKAVEHTSHVLEDGSIDPEYAKHLSSPERERLNAYSGKYYNDFNYLQGDIYEKMDALEEEYSDGKIIGKQYERQKKALQEILPDPMGIKEITILPIDKLASEIRVSYNGEKDRKLRDAFSSWVGELPYDALEGSSRWEIDKYLDGIAVRGGSKEQNIKEKNRRRQVANKLFKKFYTEELPEGEQKKITDRFNKNFNGYVRPDYREYPLSIELNSKFYGKDFELKEIQKEGAAFLVNKGVGLLGYEVGVGKTLTAIAAIAEVMKKGWAKRPLIVVPKNLKSKWINDLMESMPNVKINDLSNLGGQFKYKGEPEDLNIEDGSLTIITEDGFKRIGYTPETYDELTRNLKDVTYKLGDKSKRDREIEGAQSEEIAGKAMKGTDYPKTFEEFGFDHLTVDEAHRAKNIFASAQSSKDGQKANEYGAVRGAVSERGLKTYLAAQYILAKNGGRNVFLMTATPFNNQPIEVYSMLSLMAKNRLESLGISNVNEFISLFCELENKFAIKANGQVMQTDQVRRFNNARQLQKLIREFMDVRTGEEAGIARPTKQKITPTIKMNEMQAKLVVKAQELFKDKEGGVLQAITELQKITLSPYLSQFHHVSFTPTELVENSPKIQYVVESIKAVHKTNPNAGQIIFSEKGIDVFRPLREYFVDVLKYKPNEVAIIDSSISSDVKDDIQDRFQNGEVKILLASGTVKEGVDLQRNSTDLYNMFLQWNPTDMIQAEGRTWRQGSFYDKVRIHYPLLENSVDPFIFQKLEEKASRISDFFSYKGDSLDVSDIDFEGMKFELITDPVLRVQAEETFARAEHDSNVRVAEAELAFMERKAGKVQEIKDDIKNLEDYKKQARERDDADDINYYAEKIVKANADLKEEQTRLKKKGVNVEELKSELIKKNEELTTLREQGDKLREKFDAKMEKAQKQGISIKTGKTDYAALTMPYGEKEFYTHQGEMHLKGLPDKSKGASIISEGESNFYDRIKNPDKTLSVVRNEKDLLTSPLKVKYKKDGYFKFPNQKINSPADIAFAFRELKNEAVEKFYVVGVKKGVPVSIEAISVGSINVSLVDPFETVGMLINKKADGAYLIHNHPSGEITPSEDDIRLTQRLSRGYKNLGIEFKGHVIIDTTKFGLIGESFETSSSEQMTRVKKPVKFDAYKKYIDWLTNKPTDFNVSKPSDAAEIAKGLNIDKTENSLLLFVDSRNKVLNAQFLPKNKLDVKKITELGSAARSRTVFIMNHGMDYYSLKLLIQKMKDVNIEILDAISFGGENGEDFISARAEQSYIFDKQTKNLLPEKMASIFEASDEKLKGFLTEKQTAKQIEKVLKQTNPFLREKMVLDIVVKIMNRNGLESRGQFDPHTNLLEISRHQTKGDVKTTTRHEIGHLAATYFTAAEKQAMVDYFDKLSTSERRDILGRNKDGGWIYDDYVEHYNGDEARLAEEIVNKQAETNDGNPIARKMRSYIRAIIEFIHRITGLMDKTVAGLRARALFEPVFNTESDFFEGRYQTKDFYRRPMPKLDESVLRKSGEPKDTEKRRVYAEAFNKVFGDQKPPSLGKMVEEKFKVKERRTMINAQKLEAIGMKTFKTAFSEGKEVGYLKGQADAISQTEKDIEEMKGKLDRSEYKNQEQRTMMEVRLDELTQKHREQKDELMAKMDLQAERFKRQKEKLREKLKIRMVNYRQVRKEMVDYIKDNLPRKSWSKFLIAVRDGKTPAALEKVVSKVDAEVSNLQRVEAIASIKKIIAKAETLPIEAQMMIKAITDGIQWKGVLPDTIKQLERVNNYLKNNPDARLSMPMRILRRLGILEKKSFKDLTTEQVIAINARLERIKQVGKAVAYDRKVLRIVERTRKLDRLMTESVNHDIFKQSGMTAEDREKITAWQKSTDKLQTADWQVMPIDSFMQRLDNGKTNGANYELIKKPVDVGFNEYWRTSKDIKNRLWDFLGKVKETQKITDKEWERIGIYAISEQKGGRAKLKGSGYTDDQIDAIKLTDPEMALYGYMRGELDAMFPTIKDVYEKTYNKELPGVENYFPFIMDWGNRQPIYQEFEAEFNFGEKGTDKGFTVSRKGGFNPVKVNALEAFIDHIDKATYFVALEPTVKEVRDLVKSHRYGAAVGEKAQGYVMKWVELIERHGTPKDPKDIRALDIIRKNVTWGVLAFKLTTIPIQLTAVFNGATEVGLRAGTGFTEYMTSSKAADFILQASPQMEMRVGDDPVYKEVSPNRKLHTAREIGMWGIKKFDYATTAGIWLGAYRQFLSNHEIEFSYDDIIPEAAMYADWVVRKTQATADYKDLPPLLVQRSRSIGKLLLQFQNFTLFQWAYIRNDVKHNLSENKSKAAWQMSMILINILVGNLIRDLIARGIYKTGKEDEESTVSKMAWQLAQTIPIAGNLMYGVRGLINYGSTSNMLSGIPAVDTFIKGSQAAGAGYVAKSPETKWKNYAKAAAAVGTLLGVPGSQQAAQIIQGQIPPASKGKSKYSRYGGY